MQAVTVRALVELMKNAASIVTTAHHTGAEDALNSLLTAAIQEVATSGAGVFTLKGNIDCSTNPNYPLAKSGDAYKVSVAGKIGGASGLVVEIGDFIINLVDAAAGTQAAVGASWDILQYNIDLAAIQTLADTASRVQTPTTSTDSASVAVAISIASKNTKLVTTVAQLGTFTLADGVEGQTKKLVLTTKGGAVNAVVTPANLQGGTIITFSSVGQSIELMFLGTKWFPIGTSTAVVS